MYLAGRDEQNKQSNDLKAPQSHREISLQMAYL